MTDQDAPPLFAGVVFLLSGFDLPTETQLSAALEQQGAVNAGDYDGSCTHIIVSRTFLWDDPICAAARKDCKCLCTELWVSDCLDLGAVQDVNHVIYRPLRDSQGIPGSKNLVVCLTGYQGQARRNVMRMVHLMGAHFSKPLIANRVTHLVCYKFEGEKFNLAKQLGLKLVNHQWLEDCLRTWALLSEEDYSRSGLEVELSEAQAKDSEDDGLLKSTSLTPKVLNDAVTMCLEGVRETGLPLDQCPQEGRKNSVHLSPNLASPKKNTVAGVGGDLQKVTTRDAFVCEMQLERRKADPNSPLVSRAKRTKATGSPEMATNSKRQNVVGNADDNVGINRELNNQHGNLRHSVEEVVYEMQLDGPDSGSSCKTEMVPRITAHVEANGNIVKTDLAPKVLVSEAGSRALSPTAVCNVIPCEEENMPSAVQSAGTCQTAQGKKHGTLLETYVDSNIPSNSGGTTLNVIACEEENMPSALLSAGTPQFAQGKKHSTILGTALDSVISNIEGLLHSKEITENIEKGITEEDLPMEVTETESTPVTGKAKSFLPPASSLLKEHESILQVKCSSAGSMKVGKPPKGISARKNRQKAVQEVLCLESTSVHSSPVKVGLVNSPVKGSLPESNMKRAGENANLGMDLRKAVEEQNMLCNNINEHANEIQLNESKLLNKEIDNLEVHHGGEVSQNAKGLKASGSKKQGKLQKKLSPRSAENLIAPTGEVKVPVKENAAQLMVHHRGEYGENVQTGTKASGSMKQGRLRKNLNQKSTEKSRLLTGEMMIPDKENVAQSMAVDKKKTVDSNTLLAGLGKEADNQNTPCNGRIPSNQNAREMQERESKLLKDEDSNMVVHSKRRIHQPAKIDSKRSGTRKQGKLLKKPDLISTKKVKSLSVETVVLDKENAVVHQSHDLKGEPKIPPKALVARKSHEKVVSPDNVYQNAKIRSQRCFALSGRRQEIKPLQGLIKKLGGKLCRDSQQWSHQTTHLVIVGQLRRTEKLFAAAAAGRWILREDFLKDSSEVGVFLDEKKYEWHGSGMTKDGSISFEAPRKWRERRENTGCCALEGLRILLYGECIIPSLDTLRRAIRAGGADLVATSPPYAKVLASKVDFAIVNPGTPKNDQWIQEFLRHRVACVTTDFFVDFVCKPSSCLDRHILYDTHHLVQDLLTHLQTNMGAKMDKEGSNDVGEDCGGEDICCVTCGRSDREDVMLLCGDDNGSGCGIAMHIDCCKPPLDKVPAHDWYCVQCTKPSSPRKKGKKRAASLKG